MQIENEPMQEMQEEQENQQPQDEKKKVDVKKEIISWILYMGTAVIAAFLIRTFLFEPIRVDGSSMADTLQNGILGQIYIG